MATSSHPRESPKIGQAPGIRAPEPVSVSNGFRRAGIVLVLGVLLLEAGSRQTCAQVLDQLRDDVRGRNAAPDRESDSGGNQNSDRRRCDGEDDAYEGLTELAGWFALYAVTSPIWAPRSLVGDGSLCRGYFARYPYRCDLPGYMATDPGGVRDFEPPLADEHYNWLLRTRIEYSDSFDDLSRIGGQVLWDTASRWGIDSQFDYLREERTGSANDQLWLGDANVVYRFAQSPRLQMRTGLGVNWMSDTDGTDLGFNFTYGGDLFLANPWIVSAEVDWGWLGNAGLFRGRTTLGVHLHRWEFYTGYEYLDVGRTQLNSLLGGVRLWY